MRVCINEESELTTARFIKSLFLNITNKVDLTPYFLFDDV